MSLTEIVPVTQADRDAAASALGYASWEDATDYRLTGAQDRQVAALVQAFARHRLSAIGECAPAPTTCSEIAGRAQPTEPALSDGLEDTSSAVAGQRLEAWQPIETAPKDGSFVLLYQRGRSEITCGHWLKREQTWVIDGWRAQPTHWQPLPAAPTTHVDEVVDRQDEGVPTPSASGNHATREPSLAARLGPADECQAQ